MIQSLKIAVYECLTAKIVFLILLTKLDLNYSPIFALFTKPVNNLFLFNDLFITGYPI